MFLIQDLYSEAELGVQHYHSQPSPGIGLTCTLSRTDNTDEQCGYEENLHCVAPNNHLHWKLLESLHWRINHLQNEFNPFLMIYQRLEMFSTLKANQFLLFCTS